MNRKFAFTVSISEKDPLYSEVHKWLLDVLPSEKNRALSVSTRNVSNGSMEISESPNRSSDKIDPLTIMFDESGERQMLISGHKTYISLNIPDQADKAYQYREPSPATIKFKTYSYAGQQAVISRLEELNLGRATTRKAVLKVMNQWGGWATRSDLPPRTMESVILPEGQVERIAGDLRKFLDSEEKYNKLAIPWHRGYMFHGPPGTGKTSLIKALANDFNLDLWYVSISDIKDEGSLIGLLSDVGPRSILLLEDIDVLRITHDRDGADPGRLNMSSLLNVLDGVATPHGLITVMTTNHFDILDPALTRAGRMDMVEEITYPTANIVSDIFEFFYGKEPSWLVTGGHPASFDIPINKLSASTIVEIMKRNMDDPEAAQEEISEELSKYELIESVSDYLARTKKSRTIRDVGF